MHEIRAHGNGGTREGGGLPPDFEPPRPFGEEWEGERQPCPQPPDRRTEPRARFASALSIVLFCASIFALLFAFRAVPPLNAFAERVPWTALLGRLGTVGGTREPVVSHLSTSAKAAILAEAFAILDGKRAGLLEAENALRELETEKNGFLVMMEEKKEALKRGASVFEIGEGETAPAVRQALKSSAASLSKEIDRRTGLFLEQYRSRKEALVARREELKREIKRLSAYIGEARGSGGRAPAPELSLLFQRETEQALLAGFLLQVERGEYGRAAATLERLSALGGTGGRKTQTDLLVRALRKNVELAERSEHLRSGGTLGELKMAYLGENYEKALDLSERIGKSGYMLPVLAEFQGAVKRNLRLVHGMEGDKGLEEHVRGLGRKALALEKNGEFEKALKIYKDLLIFDLGPADREYAVNRMSSVIASRVKADAVRRENTEASRYLADARKSEREGREREALEQYKRLVTRCPNSDYLGEALDRAILLASAVER